jgi:type VI secretion system protein ImpG
MDDLLPHYERELAFLRGHAGEFAKAYPKIAGRLMLTGDVGEDPHVERLIESFALLAARVHKRLDDDFPLFTESFLEVLYPHYLRPFPSCAIARFDHASAAAQASRPGLLPRGTLLTSRPVRGVACRFRTTSEVELLPLHVASASFRGAVQAPAGTPLPRGATSLLSIQLELASAQASWGSLQGSRLRLYLDGEASQAVVLREALLGRIVGSLVQAHAHGPWAEAPEAQPQSVGFADDEALIEPDARSHPAYRLLTEYFAFPDKFNFVDITLPAAAASAAGRSITLHYPLAGVRGDSDEARLLDTVNERNLLTGCAPVVNLFKQRADPIRVTHAAEAYPVLPDGRRAFAYEVHSVERVWRLQQSAQGEQVVEFKPFYSLQHDELLAEGEDRGRYWATRRDEAVAAASPGHETELSIVDVDFDPALPSTDTLSVEVLATNRDLPAMLAAGGPGGDLFLEGGSLVQGIRLLRKPTPPQRFERGRGALWRLVSHLSVNHLSLAEGGLDALKELLRLYDLPRSAVSRRLLDGLVAIDYRRTSAWLPGEPFPAFVRGIEVRLSVDDAHFVGAGLRLFAQVMDHFFGLYVHLNSFVQLKILSSRTQEELIACPPRSGHSPLL